MRRRVIVDPVMVVRSLLRVGSLMVVREVGAMGAVVVVRSHGVLPSQALSHFSGFNLGDGPGPSALQEIRPRVTSW